MKKTYINPTVEAYLIQTRNNLLTTSEVTVSSDDLNVELPGTEILAPENDFDFSEAFKNDFSE